MLERFFSFSSVIERLRAGPLGAYIDTFASLLSELGYAKATARGKIRLVSDFSQWLERRRVGVDELDEQKVVKFLRHRQKQARAHCGGRSTIRQLLEHLRECGVLAHSVPEKQDSTFRHVESDFERYLVQERGLSDATVLNYGSFVRRFLHECFKSGVVQWEQIGAPDVTRFVLRHAHTGSPGRAKLMVGALRALFRFVYLRGDIATDLAASVPTVADRRLSELPKFLEPEEVEHLLESCDQRRDIDQRDYAILLLLARLGLRGGEVVAMMLEDIHWEAGELTVRGKGGREDRLPLLQEVGEALATYLRHGRPRCASRRVFIRMKAPLQGFASSVAICNILRRALERAGLHPPRKGAHLLRHSLATGMLRGGASMAEIGEILRHRLPSTTEIYAKVDLEALRGLAPPWPGGAP